MLNEFGRLTDTAGLKEVSAAPYVSVSELNCPPLSIFSPVNSLYSRFIVWPKGCIKSVIASGDIAEVGKPIIGLDSVNMVDMKRRPLTSHIEPSDTVFFVHSTHNADVSIAATGTTSTIPSFALAPVFGVSKNSSLRVVMQQFFEIFKIHFTTSNSGLIGGGSYNCRTPNYTKIRNKGLKLC